MSVVVTAVPVYLIYSLISTCVASAAASAAVGAKMLADTRNFDNMVQRIGRDIGNGEFEINSENLKEICKEYETVFVDKDLLLKTLNEYGFDEIKEIGGQINCKTKGFTINFYKDVQLDKDNNPAPYKMFIKSDCSEESVNELLGDLNEQYSSNTQEESYNKVKERLKNHNLEINEEEVLDDNTIVLTVNID